MVSVKEVLGWVASYQDKKREFVNWALDQEDPEDTDWIREYFRQACVAYVVCMSLSTTENLKNTIEILEIEGEDPKQILAAWFHRYEME